MSSNLPEEIMGDTLWSFAGDTYDTRAEFSDEVREYHLDIEGEDTWRPDEVVLPVPRVKVSYEYWNDDGDEEEAELDLTAENGKNFTALDLLFQIHNAVVERLRDMDHHFFEGLEVESAPDGDGIPRALLWLGS